MSGKIDPSIFTTAIILISLIASITDLIWGKIYNWFCLTVALLGIVVSVYSIGWLGLATALGGIGIGFGLYALLYAVRFIGGGDVKFLMALGAWGGAHYALEVGILAVIVGGLLAFIILMFTGRIVDFSKRAYISLLSIVVPELEFIPVKINKSLIMPFGIPIAIAACWVAFYHPFESWGIILWI